MGIVQTAITALKVLNQAGNLIKSDKEVSDALQTFVAEAGDELKAAAASDAADAGLKEAFNNVASLLPLAQQFAREGKLSISPMIGVFTNAGKYEKSINTLTEAFNANNPAVIGLVDSITSSKSLIKLAAKTNGSVFSVQDGPDGTGVVNVLFSVPGIPERFSLCQADYAELKAFLKAGEGPQPPKNPPAPGL